MTQNTKNVVDYIVSSRFEAIPAQALTVAKGAIQDCAKLAERQRSIHLLAVHEAELEEPALQRRQGRRDRADADHPRGGAGGQRGEAHETRFESKSFRCGGGVHGSNYG